MKCQRCNSDRIASVSAKCSDLCFWETAGIEKDGYVPGDVGIGGGDYVELSYCLECGQIQGTWPIPKVNVDALAAEKMKRDMDYLRNRIPRQADPLEADKMRQKLKQLEDEYENRFA